MLPDYDIIDTYTLYILYMAVKLVKYRYFVDGLSLVLWLLGSDIFVAFHLITIHLPFTHDLLSPDIPRRKQ